MSIKMPVHLQHSSNRRAPRNEQHHDWKHLSLRFTSTRDLLACEYARIPDDSCLGSKFHQNSWISRGGKFVFVHGKCFDRKEAHRCFVQPVEEITQLNVSSAPPVVRTWRLFRRRYPQAMTTFSPRLILALTTSSLDTLNTFLRVPLQMQQNNGSQNPGKS